MKIDITKEEYHDLLELLHVANWILIFHKTQVEPAVEKYDALIQKLYSLAGEMGRPDLVETDPGTGKYRPTKTFEDSSRSLAFIDDFVDHSFWDELIIRFAERDAARQAGGYDQMDHLTHGDRHALLDPLEKKYADEFNENGIDRLEIVERYGHIAGAPVRTHD